MTEEKQVTRSPLSSIMGDVIGGEDMLIEVARDMVKEEIRERVRKILDEDPELKRELKDAVGMYFEAKVKEAYASLKLAKSGTKLTLELLPGHMKKDLSKDLEREIAFILERALR